MTMSKESIVRNVEVRKLLAEGKTPGQVADLLKIPVANVYSVRAYDKKKQIAQDKANAKRKVGRPKGSANKRVVPMQLIDKTVLRDMQAELATLRTENARLTVEAVKVCPPPVYVEVPVPQPFSHYTFWQRLRILFLGGAA